MFYNRDIKKRNSDELRGSINHNHRRSVQRENIDFSRTNNNYYLDLNGNKIEGVDEKSIIDALIKETEASRSYLPTKWSRYSGKQVNEQGLLVKELKRNANLALSFVFSGSPEFFFDLEKSGITAEEFLNLDWKKDREKIQFLWSNFLNQKNLEKFQRVMLEHLKEVHGENLVSIHCHLDEKSPHWHVLICPRVKDNNGNWKLDARTYYSKTNLIKWNTDLERRMSKIGLYSSAEKMELITDKPVSEDVVLRSSGVAKRKTTRKPRRRRKIKKNLEILKKMPSKTLMGNYDKKETEEFIEQLKSTIKDYSVAYEEECMENEKLEGERVKFTEVIKEQSVKISSQDKILAKSKHYLSQSKSEFEEQNNALREIPLENILELLGFNFKTTSRYLEVRDRDRNLKLNIERRTGRFTENISGHTGCGSIDLVKLLLNCNFSDAKNFLIENFGLNSFAKVAFVSPKPEFIDEVVNLMEDKTVREIPTPDKKNIEKVIEYLTKNRGLSSLLVDRLISSGQIFADKNLNAIFLSRNLKTAFMRGTRRFSNGNPNKFKSIAGIPDLIDFHFNPRKNPRIYVFESVIDALSYKTRNPNARGIFISTNGQMAIKRVQEFIKQYPSSKVCLCLDNDEAGNKMTAMLSGQLKSSGISYRVLNPKFKDWNERLLKQPKSDRHKLEISNQPNNLLEEINKVELNFNKRFTRKPLL